MRRITQIIALLVLIVTLSAPFSGTLAADAFSDIWGHKYKTSIEFMNARGIVQGYTGGQFRPNQALNRAEMLKIVLEATEANPDIANRSCFKDVGSEWFAKYVCHAKDKGIVKGYSTGHFRPGQEVNMVEALKIALEAFDASLPALKSGEEWYTPYTEFAHSNNLFSKFDYFPQRSMTRGEMAFLVHQLILEDEGKRDFDGKRSNLSAGCGVNPPSTAPTSSTVDGRKRSYITVIPSGYSKDKPKKLVFAFHGRTNPNTQVRGYYRVEQASKGEAIMIYPAGLPESGPSRSWSDPSDNANNLRDYALFDQLLDEFSENYCIDLDEVYVVAHSLGAWFTNSLACARGDVIRGIGTLGGGISASNCTGPVATWIAHNPKDRLVPYSQGITARDNHLRQNQCGSATVKVSPSSLNCVEYQGCYEHAPVVWCPHNQDYQNGSYYPHNWPKGTGEAIWAFWEGL